MPDLLLIRDYFVYEDLKQNARCGNYITRVQYRTLRGLHALFDSFALRLCTGIGNIVPRSDLESWAEKRSKLFEIRSGIDRLFSNPAIFRVIADSLLPHLKQTEEEPR